MTVLDMEKFGQLGSHDDDDDDDDEQGGHHRERLTVVDATFASPQLLKPMKYGVDIVIHSAYVTHRQIVDKKKHASTGVGGKSARRRIASSFPLPPSPLPFLSPFSFSVCSSFTVLYLPIPPLIPKDLEERWRVRAQSHIPKRFCAIFGANLRILHARTGAIFICSLSSFIPLSSKFHTVLRL